MRDLKQITSCTELLLPELVCYTVWRGGGPCASLLLLKGKIEADKAVTPSRQRVIDVERSIARVSRKEDYPLCKKWFFK